MPHGDGEFLPGICGVVRADLENVQTGRRDASQIVRILVKIEKFLRGGGDEAGAGEDRHGH